ncbi:MAG: DegT/DnrJ/EryC1/StrS family aminotransferase [Planctomycetes bacterium]|nr:DegT/DnrJ/EryC1/StrS family aminotransferase [Planctomycetota bacterium]
MRYPVGRPVLGEEEAEAARRVVASGWLSQGPEVEAFEADLASILGVPPPRVVAVSSGTAALHLALAALGVGPGDEVILPSLTFRATSDAVRQAGATPVHAEIASPLDPTLDPAEVGRLATRRTRAVIAVHYAGYPCPMAELVAATRPRGLALVEDAAHAPGARLDGAALGTLGEAGCLSFYANKNLTCGEGGAVVMRGEAAAERARRLRSHGATSTAWDRATGRLEASPPVGAGFNYRLSEVHAAIGRVQSRRLAGFNERRARIDALYRERLARPGGIELPFPEPRGLPAYHLRPVLLPPWAHRGRVRSRLREEGIETAVHFSPLHGPEVPLPRTEAYALRELSLPLHPALADEDVEVICEALEGAIRESTDVRGNVQA